MCRMLLRRFAVGQLEQSRKKPYWMSVLLRAETMQSRLEYGTKRSIQAQLQEGCLTSMQADMNTEAHAAVLRSVVWCYEQIAERVESGTTELPESEENKESEE